MALTQISSDGVKDGAIVNADIKSDAAIALSKLATDTSNASNIGSGTLPAARIGDDSIVEAKLDIHAAPSGTNKFLGYTSNGMEWAVPPDTTTPADDSVTGAKLSVSLVQGDVLYGSGTDTLARLAKGTAGQSLVMNTGATAPEWGDAAAGAGGGGSDKIFWENGQTVTTSYQIGDDFGAACNAMSAGPITINDSVTVTIASGETWTIV